MKKKNIFISLIALLSLFLEINSVSAFGSTGVGETGLNTGCGGTKGSMCYGVRVGVRVSLVYGNKDLTHSSNGVRCNYDESNNTICSKDGSGPGVASRSIDIWFGGQLMNNTSVLKSLATTKKMTKQEFLKDAKNYGYARDYYFSNTYYAEEIPEIAFLGGTGANALIRKGSESSAKYITNFSNDFLYPILQIDGDKKVSSSTKWGSYTYKENGELTTKPIRKKLVSLMTSSSMDIEKMDVTNVYFQFDQLIQYGYYVVGDDNWKDAVIGTVAEVAYYWKYRAPEQENWCISEHDDDVPGHNVPCGENGISKSGYGNGWYAPASAQPTPGSTVTTTPIKLGLEYGPKPETSWTFESYLNNDTVNVAYYWLANENNPCSNDTELDDFLKTGSKLSPSEIATLVKKFELKYFGSSKIQYEGLNSDNRLSRMNEFIIRAFGLPNNNIEACSGTMDCNETAASLYYCYVEGRSENSEGMLLGPHCKKGSDSDSTYNALLKELASYYGIDFENSLLNYKLYKSLGKKMPSCNSTPPASDCETSLPSISCGNKFIFKDADFSKQKQCWGAGIAYKSPSGVIVSSLENQTTHDDASCVKHGCSGSHTCNTYCYEEVEFDFPDKPNETKAGQVFKWGDDHDLGSNVFGTMKVTKKCSSKSDGNDCTYHTSCRFHCHRWRSCGRDCITCASGKVDYATNKTGKITPDTIDATDWKDDVKTEVELIYKEPTDDSIYPSPNPKLIIDTSKTVSNGRYTGVACRDSSCSNDTVKTMSNEYTFVYSEELNWSSYKVDNSLVAQADNEDYYYHIGYGFPTAFTTPDGSYGPTGNGELTARITNIGTKTSGSSYRYDELIKPEGYVDYSCEFDIDNELYDYECCDEHGNLKAGAPSYCDPVCTDDDPDGKRKGIDVVFRTIELMGSAHPEQVKRAFPGRAGTGTRRVGSNWYELHQNPTELHKVLNSNIYSKDPQYQIKLTISNIQAIRELNESAGVDPYTEMTESSSGTTGFVCVGGSSPDGVYKRCASNFLTHLSNLGSNSLTGQCMNGGNTQGRAAKYQDGGCLQTH